jgi:hypothetical protein
MHTPNRSKPVLVIKKALKLRATGVESYDILLLVKTLFPLLGLDGGDFNPVYCSINRLFHPPGPLRNPSRFITIRHSPQHW